MAKTGSAGPVPADKKPKAAKVEEQKPIGRPTIFTKELGTTICARIAEGESLRNICKDEGMPVISTVLLWVIDDVHKQFSEQYARARESQAEVWAEEIIEISDDGTNDYMTITKGDESYNVEDREVTNRSKLRVDSRKWYLSKVLPKKFGEKLDVTSGGKVIKGNAIILKDFDGAKRK